MDERPRTTIMKITNKREELLETTAERVKERIKVNGKAHDERKLPNPSKDIISLE